MRAGTLQPGREGGRFTLRAPRGRHGASFPPEATRSSGRSAAQSSLTAPLRGRLSVSRILQRSKLGHLTQLGGRACALRRFSLSLFLPDPPSHLLTSQARAVVGITSAPTLLGEAGRVAKPQGDGAGEGCGERPSSGRQGRRLPPRVGPVSARWLSCVWVPAWPRICSES